MPTLNDMLHRHSGLAEADIEWLHLLVGDWQLLSDLSFADLVLWVADQDGGGWVAVAHVRPSTGATVYYDDVVGSRLPRGRRVQLDRAYDLGRILSEREADWHEEVPVREETVPVVRHGHVLGVISRHTNLATARTPSRLELTYMQCADDLTRMIATGDYPFAGATTGSRRGAPRVGDGLLRLDREGRVSYASPNALSALHRLGWVGDLMNRGLAEIVPPLLSTGGPVDESLPLVLTGRAPWRSDIEARGTTLSLRALPLKAEGERVGALVLLRDVSELRRRERELLSKDATIREVHHRVKNNLQTVAALLRLQARRLPQDNEGRIALQEAMRRVSTIAAVHETLSEGLGELVDFDTVIDRTLPMAVEVAGSSLPAPVRLRREGRFGELRTETATPIALVLTELVTNAVEHGLKDRGGTVTIRVHRVGDWLTVTVMDDGIGLPEGFVPGRDGLGTQIVQALLGGERRGRIHWATPPGGGTEVTIEVRAQGAKADASADTGPISRLAVVAEPPAEGLPGSSTGAEPEAGSPSPADDGAGPTVVGPAPVVRW